MLNDNMGHLEEKGPVCPHNDLDILVFFKYSIAISLVILYLDLVPSHSCNINATEVLKIYASIVKKRLNFVEEIVKANYSNCCKSDEAARPELNHQCNILMESITGSNCTEACHVSRHKNNCSKSKELCALNCYLEKQTKKMIEGELKDQLNYVINNTFRHLCCRRSKKQNENRKRRSRPCIPVNICELKKTIYKLKSEWEQFAEKAPSQCQSGT